MAINPPFTTSSSLPCSRLLPWCDYELQSDLKTMATRLISPSQNISPSSCFDLCGFKGDIIDARSRDCSSLSLLRSTMILPSLKSTMGSARFCLSILQVNIINLIYCAFCSDYYFLFFLQISSVQYSSN